MAIVAQQNHASSFFDLFGEIEDFDLRKATNAVLETGELTPIIKEELKLFIQTRRLSHGQDELTVTFSPPNKDEVTIVLITFWTFMNLILNSYPVYSTWGYLK